MTSRASRKGKTNDEEASKGTIPQTEHSSDSDEAPEEESNESRRKSIKGLEKSRKPVKRSANVPTKRKSTEKGTVESEQDESFLDGGEPSTSSAVAAPAATHMLDPSLFAASFSRKRATSISKKDEANPVEHSVVRGSKKRFGMVKGRDGQPMKRLKDGQTIVRVLGKQPSVVNESTQEETLPLPLSLEPFQALPNAKIRAFRKQKLGLRQNGSRAKKAVVTKSMRTQEDPLGLQDPAFMKGGELEGLGLPTKRKRSARKSTIETAGSRKKFTPSMSKHGQALNFARSL
ncbi:hypothetical protein CBS101457_004688 [Exobasidium rhododendri]|nr:hypothetical protein CBS101457_004688 [Exobasidium rhododendri]